MKLLKKDLESQFDYLKLPQLRNRQEYPKSHGRSPQILHRKQFEIIDSNHSQLEYRQIRMSSQDVSKSLIEENSDKKKKNYDRKYVPKIPSLYMTKEIRQSQEDPFQLPMMHQRDPMLIGEHLVVNHWRKNDFTNQQKFQPQSKIQPNNSIINYEFQNIKSNSKELYHENKFNQSKVSNPKVSNRQLQIDQFTEQMVKDMSKSLLSPKVSRKNSRNSFQTQVQKPFRLEQLQLSLENQNNKIRGSSNFEKSDFLKLKFLNGCFSSNVSQMQQSQKLCPEMQVKVNLSISQMDQVINERKESARFEAASTNVISSDMMRKNLIKDQIQKKKNEIYIYIENRSCKSEEESPSPTLEMLYHSPVKLNKSREFSLRDKLEKLPLETDDFLQNIMQEAENRKMRTKKMKKFKLELTDLYQEHNKSCDNSEQDISEQLKIIDETLMFEQNDSNYKEQCKRSKQKVQEEKKVIKNRIPELLRKHLLPNKSNLDIFYLNGVVNLELKLLSIFSSEPGRFDTCLGNLYKSKRENIWSMYQQKQAIRRIYGKKHEENGRLNSIQNTYNQDSHTQKMNNQKIFKKGYSLFQADQLSVKSIEFSNTCFKEKVFPIPSFTEIKDQQLFLTQIKINDAQAESLKQFLISQKYVPEFQIKTICIIDCGMTDIQFSKILEGLRLQSSTDQTPFIKSILYQSGQLGEQSCQEMTNIIEHLDDLQFISLTGSGLQSKLVRILQTCNEKNLGLKKLKFSKTNLNDDRIVSQICKSLKYMSNLTSLALPWSSLSSKHMYQISESLNNNENVIINLNLAHNSLTFVEPFNNHKENFYNSQDFFQEICEYFQKTKFLVHLDISGLSFEKDQLKTLCTIISGIQTLSAIHLSGMGIKRNFDKPEEDLMIELLDIFGISETYNQVPRQIVNQHVKSSTELQEVIKSHYKLSRKLDQGLEVGDIQNKIVMIKQSKLVSNNKVFNSSEAGQGAGISSSIPTDLFVLTRKINMPELIFNNDVSKDLLWEVDQGEMWKLSRDLQNPSNECFLCQKYKYAMIFFDQSLKNNKDLEEIKDENLIKQVTLNLNLGNDIDDYAPIICGSVINGTFKRKLQMLRGDLYTLLSMSQSELLIKAKNQETAIKKGVHMIATRSQNAQSQTITTCLNGWEDLLVDKTFNNELIDVEAINFPSNLKNNQQNDDSRAEEPCSLFVYSAFVVPGIHQFLIYLPERIIKVGDDEVSGQPLPSGDLKDQVMVPARLFVKSMIINLSCFDQYLSMPIYVRKEKVKKKKTFVQVFRLWNPLKKENIDSIINTDCLDQNSGFDASLFMKERNDVKNAFSIFKNNFQMIQVVFQEMQAQTFINSQGDYPKISFSVFYNSIREVQNLMGNQRKSFNRPSIELCYQGVTRGDSGSRISGNISRGQLLELILRCTNHFHQQEKEISVYVQEFLNDYIDVINKKSKIYEVQKIVLNHQQLNNFLSINLKGLQMIFDRIKNNGGFLTFETILSLFPSLPGITKEQLSQILKYNFVGCQMTRFFDQDQPEKYDQIVFVEFLVFLGRLSIDYFNEKQDSFAPKDLEDQCFELLKLIWVKNATPKTAKATPKKETGPKQRVMRKRNKKEKIDKDEAFPELNRPISKDNNEY